MTTARLKAFFRSWAGRSGVSEKHYQWARMAFCLYNVSRCEAQKAEDHHSQECETLWEERIKGFKMKTVQEVLAYKLERMQKLEAELIQLQKEVEALHFVQPLLLEDTETFPAGDVRYD